MAYFLVKTGNLTAMSISEQAESIKLNSLQASILNIAKNLDMEIASISKIKASLNEVAGQIGRENNAMRGMSSALNQIAQKYDTTEALLCGPSAHGDVINRTTTVWNNMQKDALAQMVGMEINNVKNATSNTKGAKDVNFDWKWKDLFLKTAGKFGFVGATVKTIEGIISGDGSLKSNIKNAGGVVSTIGKYVSDTANKKGFLEKIFGIGKSVGKKNIKAAFKDEMLKYSMKNAKSLGDKIKVGVKWLGDGVTVITNAIGNYEEYKSGKISAGRAVAETVIESATEIGLGIGIGVIGGMLGAPAIAVGAATIGVAWAFDRVSNLFFKRDLKEAVADGLCYVGGAAGKVVKETVEEAKKAVDKGIKKVKSVGKAILGFGKNLVSWA